MGTESKSVTHIIISRFTLYIEKRIDNGQTEAISELMNQIRLYDNLKNRAEYILERTLKNK